ncbi:MAG: sialate O-acetylesterase [Prevotella sp.]|nr:sialate O-acetylesterase [Prevotella sp.]
MMRNILKNNLLLASFFFISLGVNAKVTLPEIFSDGMVLQRETSASLWGTAKQSSVVKITTSWDKKTYVAKSDSLGKWKTAVKTPEAGGPYQITFSDGERTEINDILIGEVWVCSGQSNMEMPMKGYKCQPVDNALEDILHSTDNDLRLFTVAQNSTLEAVDTLNGKWAAASPASVRNFSATAYYFGRELRQILGVPVGLVVAAWGGSACEAWMRADWLSSFPSVQIPIKQEDITSKNRTPTVLFNGMLSPIIGMAMRGVIWYQGEDNVTRFETYADLLTSLIGGWRSVWGLGDFPFYYCQIAPYDYSLIGYTINSALLREQQSKAEFMSDNCGMVVLMDAGLEYGIHPRKKNLAGERLAMLALGDTYGIDGLPKGNAYYDDITFKGDTAVISFKRADMWVYGENGMKSDLFEISGSNRVFYPAKAWIDRSKVYVQSDSVPNPVAVRYAFKDWAQGDLFSDGLPISSFRTDDW